MFKKILFLFLFSILLSFVAEANEEEAAVYNARGVTHYQAEEWEEALTCFLRAYELTPNHETVRRNLCNTHHSIANMYAERSDFESAMQHLTYAVNLMPDDPAPLIHLAWCLLRLNHVEEAILRLEEAVTVSPDNMDAQELLGDAYYRASDVLSALAQWEWVQKEKPNAPGLAEKIEKAYREHAVEQGYNWNRSRHFQVRYAPGVEVQVGPALTLLERAYRELGWRFGGIYPTPPIPVIVYTTHDFSAATLLGPHVGAVYDGTIRIPVRDQDGAMLEESELYRRLYHEYTHVLVRHIAGNNVPWWFNEGCAETFSTELSRDDTNRLLDAYRRGRAFPIAALEEHQLMRLKKEDLGLAYLQAHAAVRRLVELHGMDPLVRMLILLGEGKSGEEALFLAYGRNYVDLEQEMHRVYGGRVGR